MYGIRFYFQLCDPLLMDTDHIIQFVFYSLIYVFFGAYSYKYFDSKKRRIKNFKNEKDFMKFLNY